MQDFTPEPLSSLRKGNPSVQTDNMLDKSVTNETPQKMLPNANVDINRIQTVPDMSKIEFLPSKQTPQYFYNRRFFRATTWKTDVLVENYTKRRWGLPGF